MKSLRLASTLPPHMKSRCALAYTREQRHLLKLTSARNHFMETAPSESGSVCVCAREALREWKTI